MFSARKKPNALAQNSLESEIYYKTETNLVKTSKCNECQPPHWIKNPKNI